MKLHSFPKVFNLGHPAISELLRDEVIVQEKIDGSQISFALIDDEIHIRSKNAEIFGDNPNDMFAKGVEVIHSLRDKLTPNWVYRGEYLRSPKHNALEYSRCPKNHIVLFDIEVSPNEFLDYISVSETARSLDLDPVFFLYEGKIEDHDQLKELMDIESQLGGPIEGYVIKNYSRFGRDGKVLMGKHVSEQFKETNKTNWKKQNPSKGDIIQLLIEQYRNENRWEKAYQHLRDSGNLEHGPRDIGVLIKEAQNDIIRECEEEIKEALWDYAKSHITRGAVKGLPEWYKSLLVERQFDDNQ